MATIPKTLSACILILQRRLTVQAINGIMSNRWQFGWDDRRQPHAFVHILTGFFILMRGPNVMSLRFRKVNKTMEMTVKTKVIWSGDPIIVMGLNLAFPGSLLSLLSRSTMLEQGSLHHTFLLLSSAISLGNTLPHTSPCFPTWLTDMISTRFWQ